MTRIRIPFTKEQKEAFEANPFTLSVNDYQIRFTVEFKKYLLAEREKNDTPWKEVFRKAGYDLFPLWWNVEPDTYHRMKIS